MPLHEVIASCVASSTINVVASCFHAHLHSYACKLSLVYRPLHWRLITSRSCCHHLTSSMLWNIIISKSSASKRIASLTHHAYRYGNHAKLILQGCARRLPMNLGFILLPTGVISLQSNHHRAPGGKGRDPRFYCGVPLAKFK